MSEPQGEAGRQQDHDRRDRVPEPGPVVGPSIAVGLPAAA